MTKKNIYILGASDIFELVEAVMDSEKARIAGYFALEDSDRSMNVRYEYLGKDPLVQDACFKDEEFIVALFSNTRRREIQETLVDRGLSVVSICHPSAIVYPSATIGRGSIVAANVVISAVARLEEGVYVNYGSLIGHDVVVGRYSFISPGVQLLGNVQVGENALIGAGAIVLPGVAIGNNVDISAGTVITRDVPDNTKVLSHQKVRFLPNEG